MTRSTRRRGVRLLLATVLTIAAGVWAALPALAAVSITVSKTEGLNPKGETVTVTGSGYKPDIQLYLVACNPAVPNGGACDLANFSLVDVGADGTWSSKLKVVAKFGTVNCLQTACAIQTSRVGEGADRTQEAIAPITFTGQTVPAWTPTATPGQTSSPSVTTSPSDSASPSDSSSPVVTPTTTDAASSTASGGTSPAVWIVIAVVVVAAIVGGAVALSRRKDGSS